MSKHTRSLLVRYGITAVVSVLISVGTMYLYGFQVFQTAALVDKYRILCDVFTVPGVLLVMFGLLLIVSNKGAFEGIGYALKHAIMMLIPGVHNQEEYYDYVQRRRAKKAKGFGCVFVVGLIDLAVAGVFMILFYHLYG